VIVSAPCLMAPAGFLQRQGGDLGSPSRSLRPINRGTKAHDRERGETHLAGQLLLLLFDSHRGWGCAITNLPAGLCAGKERDCVVASTGAEDPR